MPDTRLARYPRHLRPSARRAKPSLDPPLQTTGAGFGNIRPLSSVACHPDPPMTALKLKTVTRTQGNNQALKDGSVKPRTFAFDFEEVPVLIDAFRRMVRGHEFAICEMAMTTYVCARA